MNPSDTRSVETVIQSLLDERRIEWGGMSALAVRDKLAAIGRPAVEPLITALKDPSWRVQWTAAETLGLIGDSRAVEPLKVAARQGADIDVKLAALHSLEQILGYKPPI